MLYGELCAQIAKPFKIRKMKAEVSIYNLSSVCLSILVTRQTSLRPQTGRRARTDGRLGVLQWSDASISGPGSAERSAGLALV